MREQTCRRGYGLGCGYHQSRRQEPGQYASPKKFQSILLSSVFMQALTIRQHNHPAKTPNYQAIQRSFGCSSSRLDRKGVD